MKLVFPAIPETDWRIIALAHRHAMANSLGDGAAVWAHLQACDPCMRLAEDGVRQRRRA